MPIDVPDKKVAMTLRQWALSERVDLSRAYRQFRAGELRDRAGNPVYAERLSTRTILVFPGGRPKPPDPLRDVDPHALVAKLAEAGFVVLTREQAAQLGVVPPALRVATG